MKAIEYDCLVIGGGPSGCVAALNAFKAGAKVAVVEREKELGGILNQCTHNGFAVRFLNEDLKGTELSARLKAQVAAAGIKVYYKTSVIDIHKDKTVLAVCAKEGLLHFKAKSIILCYGCRERSAGSMRIGGNRPTGIYTAGLAQKLVNCYGFLCGQNALILGSQDIGLLMAREIVRAGGQVKMVLEHLESCKGLLKNKAECLDAFNIPLYTGMTITKIVGKNRVEGAYVAKVDKRLKPIAETEEFVECDTVILSVALEPESEMIANTGIAIDEKTGGMSVDENFMANAEGIFACGNALYIHASVDDICFEAEKVGALAAAYALDKGANKAKHSESKQLNVNCSWHFKFAVPQKINAHTKKVTLFFKAVCEMKRVNLYVKQNDKIILTKEYELIGGGEVNEILIEKFENADIKLELRKMK